MNALEWNFYTLQKFLLLLLSARRIKQATTTKLTNNKKTPTTKRVNDWKRKTPKTESNKRKRRGEKKIMCEILFWWHLNRVLVFYRPFDCFLLFSDALYTHTRTNACGSNCYYSAYPVESEKLPIKQIMSIWWWSEYSNTLELINSIKFIDFKSTQRAIERVIERYRKCDKER